MLETVDALVEALGGTTAVAAIIGVGPSTVSNWRTWNRIPPRLFFKIEDEALRRGLAVDRRLFGFFVD